MTEPTRPPSPCVLEYRYAHAHTRSPNAPGHTPTPQGTSVLAAPVTPGARHRPVPPALRRAGSLLVAQLASTKASRRHWLTPRASTRNDRPPPIPSTSPDSTTRHPV